MSTYHVHVVATAIVAVETDTAESAWDLVQARIDADRFPVYTFDPKRIKVADVEVGVAPDTYMYPDPVETDLA